MKTRKKTTTEPNIPCPAWCVMDFIKTHIFETGCQLTVWIAGLPIPFGAGSWKQRSTVEATHLPNRAGF